MYLALSIANKHFINRTSNHQTPKITEKQVAVRLAKCLTIICQQGDAQAAQNPNATVHNPQGWVTRFHAVQPPQVSVQDYLVRLQKYFHCSNENFILAFVYLDRVITINPDQLKISTYIIHRLIVTALVIAAKYHDDIYYSNTYYAKVAGVSAAEMNHLEAHFLHLLNWNVHVSAHEYNRYREIIENYGDGQGN